MASITQVVMVECFKLREAQNSECFVIFRLSQSVENMSMDEEMRREIFNPGGYEW